MPIMAVQDQNDARGTARLLANAARRSIQQYSGSASDKVALGGLFRLLKAYRSHRLNGFEYQPRRDHALEGMTIVSPGESHVAELRSALENALTEVYQDQEAGLEALEQVLRSVAREGGEAPSQDVQRTTVFLGSFLGKLEATA